MRALICVVIFIGLTVGYVFGFLALATATGWVEDTTMPIQLNELQGSVLFISTIAFVFGLFWLMFRIYIKLLKKGIIKEKDEDAGDSAWS